MVPVSLPRIIVLALGVSVALSACRGGDDALSAERARAMCSSFHERMIACKGIAEGVPELSEFTDLCADQLLAEARRPDEQPRPRARQIACGEKTDCASFDACLAQGRGGEAQQPR